MLKSALEARDKLLENEPPRKALSDVLETLLRRQRLPAR